MITLRKAIIGGALAAALGMGAFEAFRNSRLHEELQALQQKQALLGKQVQQLRQERDDARGRLDSLLAQNGQLKTNRNGLELLKLRGEITMLRAQARELAQLKSPDAQSQTDPMEPAARDLAGKMNFLKQRLEQMPDKNIPELKYLDGDAWARVAQTARLDTDAGVRQALAELRNLAKADFAPQIAQALRAYIQANAGQLPPDASQLRPYFELPVDDAILARYQMIGTGNAGDLPSGQMIVAEKAAVDDEYDYLFQIGLNSRKSVGNHTSEVVVWSPLSQPAPTAGK
jgi:hypothetical protein